MYLAGTARSARTCTNYVADVSSKFSQHLSLLKELIEEHKGDNLHSNDIDNQEKMEQLINETLWCYSSNGVSYGSKDSL